MAKAIETNKTAKAKSGIDYQGQTPLAFWLGVVFFVLVLVAIVVIGWRIQHNVAAEEAVPVTSIVIDGEMPYSVRADVEEAIANVNLGNFFQLNVDQIHRQVEALPWVKSVSVRKQWPNQLNIYVVDQTPVAMWNGDFLLNVDGQAFQADISRVRHGLPAFYGPEGSELTALENYHNLNQLLGFAELAIDELLLTERFSWQLTLNDGVVLNLGRENRVERIQRFIDVYPQIKQHQAALTLAAKSKKKGRSQELPKVPQIDYIDLRYDTGLAVGWQQSSKQES